MTSREGLMFAILTRFVYRCGDQNWMIMLTSSWVRTTTTFFRQYPKRTKNN